MILVLDNYDSFVHNVARYLRRLGAEVCVVRSDGVTADQVEEMAPSHLVISPGPCTPAQAGVSVPLVRALGGRVPILGICLGHQAIAEAWGARVERSDSPVHGRSTPIFHSGEGLFRGVPSPFEAGRYHSLAVPRDTIPDALEVVAWTDEGEVMALRHRSHPTWGVQFHPESILTEHGGAFFERFLALEGSQMP